MLSVVVANQDNTDLWTIDLASVAPTRLTFHDAADWAGVWTPDARHVAFESTRGGSLNLYLKAADGTGALERLTESASLHHALAISSDGVLLFEEQRVTDGTWDIVALSLEGGERRAVLDSDSSERAATLSADGSWLAYQSDESGRDEIYVRPFPDVSGGKWQVSTDGGLWPAWGPDGRELYFLSEQGMTRVSVETEPTFRAGPGRILFDTTGYVVKDQFNRPYDVSPDDARLLMLHSAVSQDAALPAEIHVVLNWFQELERLVPTK